MFIHKLTFTQYSVKRFKYIFHQKEFILISIYPCLQDQRNSTIEATITFIVDMLQSWPISALIGSTEEIFAENIAWIW